MSEFTPGPWKIGFKDGSGVDEFWIVGPNDTAVVHGRGDCCHVGGIHEEANARLIAAAPDLLEAVRQFLESDPYTGGNEAGRRAYLKATGEMWKL